jgi:hypothetical protein
MRASKLPVHATDSQSHPPNKDDAAMARLLLIEDLTSITFNAYLTSTQDLQLAYQSSDLPAPNDHTEAVHDTQNITFYVPHFSPWQVSAKHWEGENQVSWTVGSSDVSYTFTSATTDPIPITFVATHTSTQQEKTKIIYLDVKPKDSLPDRP